MNAKKIVVDGLLTNYVQAGAGRTILLLHGWGDSAAGLQDLQKKLSESYEVIAVDLPGFGSTQTPGSIWKLNDYAQFVSSFLGKLDINPYAILGHSNGGAIAIHGVSSGLLYAEKLVLLASAGIRDEHKGRKNILRVVAKGAKALTAPLPRNMQDKIKRKAYQAIGSDLFVAEHLQETFKNIVTADVRKDAANVVVPTLLIYGDADTATPVRYGKIFEAAMPYSHLEVVKGAGHFVHIDQKDAVYASIQRFLQ